MKYIIIVPDGMADWPIEQIGNKTPLEAAQTTNMDFLAQNGMTGQVQTIPLGMPPGSDIGNLAIMGYDPKTCFSGRAPLEAANLGIELSQGEIAFRCNLVTVENNKMIDYSAGHIQTAEADKLIHALNEEIGSHEVSFYTGKSYRHLMVLKSKYNHKLAEAKTVPPHDMMGADIAKHLPRGINAEVLTSIMEKAGNILQDHPINQVRMDLKENPANMIWLWGQGIRPRLPLFKEKYGLQGAIISAVDLVNGIGKLIGHQIIKVPNVTGYYDTNYLGKATYGLESLKSNDFVYIHIEAPDEAGHNGDLKNKISCIERIDKEIVGTVLNHFDKNDDFRVLVLPDHATPIKKRTHTNEPVCFVMFGKGINSNGAQSFSEVTARGTGLLFKSGEELIQYFIKKNL